MMEMRGMTKNDFLQEQVKVFSGKPRSSSCPPAPLMHNQDTEQQEEEKQTDMSCSVVRNVSGSYCQYETDDDDDDPRYYHPLYRISAPNPAHMHSSTVQISEITEYEDCLDEGAQYPNDFEGFAANVNWSDQTFFECDKGGDSKDPPDDDDAQVSIQDEVSMPLPQIKPHGVGESSEKTQKPLYICLMIFSVFILGLLVLKVCVNGMLCPTAVDSGGWQQGALSLVN